MIKKISAFFAAAVLGFCFCADVYALPDTNEPVDMSVPLVSAKSAILINAEDGSVYYEKNPDERLGMASTTKLMTALVVSERLDPDKAVTVPKEAVGIEGSSIYLTEGERITVRELLYALLLSSANDAAVALALECADSIEGFCALMNEKADKMGLVNTNFTNPHGLFDENHYTTARELATVGRHALNNELIAEIVATKKATVSHDGEADARLLVNHNKLLGKYDGAIGMKTGFTKKTGRTLVSAARRDGLTLIAVTLDAPDDWRDHKAMLDYGFEHYEKRVFYKAGEYSADIPLSDGYIRSVKVINTLPLALTVRKDCKDFSVRVEGYSRFLTAPVKAGEPFGQVVITADGKEISSPLVVAEGAAGKTKIKRNIFQIIADIFR
ncbi:MAG: D-alanyl-D-alanine carboxypeptidase [Ruminococcaceae bacterium]|nr:D-alanyl-D-alanine carboxypeptidase [Oscillospiraceae bacterium]